MKELKHSEELLLECINYLMEIWENEEPEKIKNHFKLIGFTDNDLEYYDINESLCCSEEDSKLPCYKNKDFVYILREDMYNEWSLECGATNLISVSYNLDTILEDLRKYIIFEKEEDEERIVNNKNQDIDDILQNVKFELFKSGSSSVCIYVNEEDYDNGKESGVLVIQEMRLK